jgi:hypothetical protein
VGGHGQRVVQDARTKNGYFAPSRLVVASGPAKPIPSLTIHYTFLILTSSFFVLISSTVVSQSYIVNIMDELVLRGNPAILKCHIPSFVSDFVFVEAWIDDEGEEYTSNVKQDTFGRVFLPSSKCFSYSRSTDSHP